MFLCLTQSPTLGRSGDLTTPEREGRPSLWPQTRGSSQVPVCGHRREVRGGCHHGTIELSPLIIHGITGAVFSLRGEGGGNGSSKLVCWAGTKEGRGQGIKTALLKCGFSVETEAHYFGGDICPFWTEKVTERQGTYGGERDRIRTRAAVLEPQSVRYGLNPANQL